MQKPYINKVDTLEDFTVWIVDGEYIRNNIDREFTNFGQHFRFPFIPKHEFWIDRHKSAEEQMFFIEHLQVEWHYMSLGETYDVAIGKADKREQALRNRSNIMVKIKTEESKHPTEVPKIIYKNKLEEFSGGVAIWIVNGEAVRDAYFIDYTEGGHHFVYHFVPKMEVWIDNDLIAEERGFVVLHELHERNLMANGMNYDRAHASSSAIEYICRRDPSKLAQYIKTEIDKNVVRITT